MSKYSTINVLGRQHVIRELEHRIGQADPNYHNTGMALCGVVNKGENLNDWEKQKEERIKKRADELK